MRSRPRETQWPSCPLPTRNWWPTSCPTRRCGSNVNVRSTGCVKQTSGVPNQASKTCSSMPAFDVNAVLVNVTAPAQLDQVRRVLDGWGDVRVFTSEEQVELILQGVVQRAKMQIGLFTLILTLTAAAIVMMVIYTMMLEKTHDIAVLKLLGAPAQRLVFLVLQQAWLLGAVGYGMAFVLGQLVYPSFPRRVFLTPQILWGAPVVVFVLTTIASMLGVAHAMRVDAGRVLEG
jgi:putative ABC transport system permease protein